MEIEDWLPFDVDTKKAAAIARLEIERYQLKVKKGMTCNLEDAALFFGVMAGIAYANIEHDLHSNEDEDESDYVKFLEKLLTSDSNEFSRRSLN